MTTIPFRAIADNPVLCNYQDISRCSCPAPVSVSCKLKGHDEVGGFSKTNVAVNKITLKMFGNEAPETIVINNPSQPLERYIAIRYLSADDPKCDEACKELISAAKKQNVQLKPDKYYQVQTFIPQDDFYLYSSSGGRDIFDKSAPELQVKNLIKKDGSLAEGSVDTLGYWTTPPVQIKVPGSCTICMGYGNVSAGKQLAIACRANENGSCKPVNDCYSETVKIDPKSKKFGEKSKIQYVRNDKRPDEKNRTWSFTTPIYIAVPECPDVCYDSHAGITEAYSYSQSTLVCKAKEPYNCGAPSDCLMDPTTLDSKPEYQGHLGKPGTISEQDNRVK